MAAPQGAARLSPLCSGNRRDECRVASVGPSDPALGLSVTVSVHTNRALGRSLRQQPARQRPGCLTREAAATE